MTNATINTMDNSTLINALETILAELRAREIAPVEVAEPKTTKKTATKKPATTKATAKAVEPKIEAPKTEVKKSSAKAESKATAKADKPATKTTKANKVAKAESKAIAKTYWQRNAEHKGLEVVFADKPSNEVRESLKKSGFRWHNTRKLWFAKETADRLNLVKAICTAK